MKKNQVIRKHSDIADCREASAQTFERKLNKLLANIKKRKYPDNKPTTEETFQINQLKGEIKKWRDESQRHSFQAQMHDPFVDCK